MTLCDAGYEDITAHVNFSWLVEAAEANGFACVTDMSLARWAMTVWDEEVFPEEVGSSRPAMATAVEATCIWIRGDIPSAAVQESGQTNENALDCSRASVSKFPPLYGGFTFSFWPGPFLRPSSQPS